MEFYGRPLDSARKGSAFCFLYGIALLFWWPSVTVICCEEVLCPFMVFCKVVPKGAFLQCFWLIPGFSSSAGAGLSDVSGKYFQISPEERLKDQ